MAIGFPETAVRFVFHPALTRPVDAQGRKLKKPVTQILSALRAFPCYFPLKEENPPTIKPLPACHAVPGLPDNSAEITNSVLAELLQRCRPVHTVRRSKRQVFWLRDRHTVFVFPALKTAFLQYSNGIARDSHPTSLFIRTAAAARNLYDRLQYKGNREKCQ